MPDGCLIVCLDVFVALVEIVGNIGISENKFVPVQRSMASLVAMVAYPCSDYCGEGGRRIA